MLTARPLARHTTFEKRWRSLAAAVVIGLLVSSGAALAQG